MISMISQRRLGVADKNGEGFIDSWCVEGGFRDVSGVPKFLDCRVRPGNDGRTQQPL